MPFKSGIKAERVRVYMTRNLPERVHYRLAVLARKRRVTLEEMFNVVLEKGLIVLEGETGGKR